jgi:phospholipase/carboxylesterase
MKNPQLTQPVVAWGQPASVARMAVIALHGRTQNPGDIQAVCNRIGRADFAYFAPTAANGSWYPQLFTSPLTDNEPALSHTLERVDTLVQELVDAGIARQQIVLLGFSQGACMLAEYALRHPSRYGALLIFTGSAIGPPGTRWSWPGDFAAMPVLVSGSATDPWIPRARMHDTAGLFALRGADVSEHYRSGSEHLVHDDEIRIARQLLSVL